jgi:hypothetical protein
MDQYSKPPTQVQLLPFKQSTSNFQAISKKESEKEISTKPLNK